MSRVKKKAVIPPFTSSHEFQNQFKQWSEETGIMKDLQSYMRFRVAQTLQNGVEPSAAPGITEQAANWIIAEHLLRSYHHYSLSVFKTEATLSHSLPSTEVKSLEESQQRKKNVLQVDVPQNVVKDIMKIFGMEKHRVFSDSLVTRYEKGKDTFLCCLLELLSERMEHQEQGTQMESQEKAARTAESTRLTQLRNRINQDAENRLKREIERFRAEEADGIRLEEVNKHRLKEQQLEREMERVVREQRERHEQEIQELRSKLEVEKSAFERDMYTQRQKLLEAMEQMMSSQAQLQARSKKLEDEADRVARREASLDNEIAQEKQTAQWEAQNRMREQMMELERVREEVQAEADRLHRDSKQLNEMGKLKEEIKRLRLRLSVDSQKLATAEQQAKAYKEQLAAMEQLQGNLKGSHEMMYENQKLEWISDRRQLLDKIREVQQASSHYREEGEKLRHSSSLQKERIKDLESQLDDMRKALKVATTSIPGYGDRNERGSNLPFLEKFSGNSGLEKIPMNGLQLGKDELKNLSAPLQRAHKEEASFAPSLEMLTGTTSIAPGRSAFEVTSPKSSKHIVSQDGISASDLVLASSLLKKVPQSSQNSSEDFFESVRSRIKLLETEAQLVEKNYQDYQNKAVSAVPYQRFGAFSKQLERRSAETRFGSDRSRWNDMGLMPTKSDKRAASGRLEERSPDKSLQQTTNFSNNVSFERTKNRETIDNESSDNIQGNVALRYDSQQKQIYSRSDVSSLIVDGGAKKAQFRRSISSGDENSKSETASRSERSERRRKSSKTLALSIDLDKEFQYSSPRKELSELKSDRNVESAQSRSKVNFSDKGLTNTDREEVSQSLSRHTSEKPKDQETSQSFSRSDSIDRQRQVSGVNTDFKGSLYSFNRSDSVDKQAQASGINADSKSPFHSLSRTEPFGQDGVRVQQLPSVTTPLGGETLPSLSKHDDKDLSPHGPAEETPESSIDISRSLEGTSHRLVITNPAENMADLDPSFHPIAGTSSTSVAASEQNQKTISPVISETNQTPQKPASPLQIKLDDYWKPSVPSSAERKSSHEQVISLRDQGKATSILSDSTVLSSSKSPVLSPKQPILLRKDNSEGSKANDAGGGQNTTEARVKGLERNVAEEGKSEQAEDSWKDSSSEMKRAAEMVLPKAFPLPVHVSSDDSPSFVDEELKQNSSSGNVTSRGNVSKGGSESEDFW